MRSSSSSINRRVNRTRTPNSQSNCIKYNFQQNAVRMTNIKIISGIYVCLQQSANGKNWSEENYYYFRFSTMETIKIACTKIPHLVHSIGFSFLIIKYGRPSKNRPLAECDREILFIFPGANWTLAPYRCVCLTICPSISWSADCKLKIAIFHAEVNERPTAE